MNVDATKQNTEAIRGAPQLSPLALQPKNNYYQFSVRRAKCFEKRRKTNCFYTMKLLSLGWKLVLIFTFYSEAGGGKKLIKSQNTGFKYPRHSRASLLAFPSIPLLLVNLLFPKLDNLKHFVTLGKRETFKFFKLSLICSWELFRRSWDEADRQ